jgi:hypothetical protein
MHISRPSLSPSRNTAAQRRPVTRIHFAHEARQRLAAMAPALPGLPHVNLRHNHFHVRLRSELAEVALQAVRKTGLPIYCLGFACHGMHWALSARRTASGDVVIEIGTAARALPLIVEGAKPIAKGREVRRRR